VELDRKLPAVLRGDAEPASAAERIEMAYFCWQHKRMYVTATRLSAEAFAADAKLASDPSREHRAVAAAYAALAAAGQGEDARHLPDKVIVMLRRQALGWLRADLAQYTKMAERSEAAEIETVRQRLGRWQRDAGFASVRDQAALDQLPADERQQWRQLWADVAVVRKKVEEKK